MPLHGAESGYQTYETPVVILHTGYDLPEQQKKRKGKAQHPLVGAGIKAAGLG